LDYGLQALNLGVGYDVLLSFNHHAQYLNAVLNLLIFIALLSFLHDAALLNFILLIDKGALGLFSGDYHSDFYEFQFKVLSLRMIKVALLL